MLMLDCVGALKSDRFWPASTLNERLREPDLAVPH
jgi:hypothetical protein